MKTFQWSEQEVERALDLPAGDGGGVFPRISTDTRSLGKGDLFVALKGERFDAHDYLAQAAEAGAAGAVVSRVPQGAPEGLRYFRVPDTRRALGALARHYRDRLDARVVGVVGSNGKTTTKELVRSALAPRFRVHATQGNLNNQIGVPLTLLSAPLGAEAVVVEMGTNEPGEIDILTRIVRPDAAVVTSIGEEHLEKLGDLAGVLAEETAILRGLPEHGVAMVAEEPASLPVRAREILGGERVRVAGFAPTSALHPEGGAEAIETLPDGTTRWIWNAVPIHLPLPGCWNVRNALLALGLALEWGVLAEEAARGVEGVVSTKLRGEWHAIGEMRVLADCYNSNPPSLRAAVDLLASLPAGGRKVAVVGTMRELGGSTAALHDEAARALADRVGDGIDLVVATGLFADTFQPMAAELGDRLIAAEDPVDAFAAAAPRLRPDDTLLLKASRGEALERWLDLLRRND